MHPFELCNIWIAEIAADAEIWVNGQQEDQVVDEDEDNDGLVDDEEYMPNGKGDGRADADADEGGDYNAEARSWTKK